MQTNSNGWNVGWVKKGVHSFILQKIDFDWA